MSARQEAVHEHEFEAEHGLPEPLPQGEHILWQGAPQFLAVAERVFHIRALAWYFAAILALRAIFAAVETGSLGGALAAAAWLVPPVVLALGMLLVMAWFTSRTAVYTITDRRVVMRVGIVLSLTFNLPYSRIEAAATRGRPGSAGDISLTLAGNDQIAYVHLWPHARPWHLRRSQPMLRGVVDTERVAALLAGAWRAARGEPGGGEAAESVVELALPTRAPRAVRVPQATAESLPTFDGTALAGAR